MLNAQCTSTGLTSQAIAVLKGDSKVNGVITFEQSAEGAPVTVTGDVSLNSFSLICMRGMRFCCDVGTLRLWGR
jgi:hypothetical protein